MDQPPPEPLPGPITFDFSDPNKPAVGQELVNGTLRTEEADGGATFDFNPDLSDPKKTGTGGFYDNLANKIDEGRLAEIASMVMDGVERDIQSRSEWMDTRARGIRLLGLRLEDPKSDTVAGGSPLEGMSSVRHPLLLESTVSFQAMAGGELLPASGPVKVRNDSTSPPRKPPTPATPTPAPPTPSVVGGPPPAPMPPPGMAAPPGAGVPTPPISPSPAGTMPPVAMPGMGGPPMPGGPPGIGHNSGMTPLGFPMVPPIAPPMGPPAFSDDELATALEIDMNHYLTAVATEYYPDTDRMLFYIGFGGDGFKKVYNCPLRRRPVSESVDAENLVVSNVATDLQNCGRITHIIKMRKSIVRRMQLLKEYRDVPLSPPSPPSVNPVEQQTDAVQGHNPGAKRPEDMDYEIYETYCELELDEFAPKQFKGKGIQLPFCVTIEKDSKQVLSIRRNWNEDDKECLPKQYFVQFPFIRGLGFYGLGFIHLVGNTTNALTAAWREMLDAGMFANFPGFIYNKGLGRQLTNQFRVPPGGGVGLDVGAQGRISDAVMPLPYKEPGAAFAAFLKEIEEGGRRLGAITQTAVGEGKQDAPVGTTLALIEQSTKVISSVHKRLHAAQAEEFQLLKERFREDPEAFWRHNEKPTLPWKKEQFLQALNNHDLVPVADPNNPTSLHRIAKATALLELQKTAPTLYDLRAIHERVFRIAGIDPEGLFLETPDAPPPDPRLEAVKEKAKSNAEQQAMQRQDAMLKAQVAVMQLQGQAQDRQSKERVEMIKLEIEKIRLLDAQITHQKDYDMEQAAQANEQLIKQIDAITNLRMQFAQKQVDYDIEERRAAVEQQREDDRHIHDEELKYDKEERDRERAAERHAEDMRRMEEQHTAKLEQQRALNEAKVEAAKALAKAKPKPKAK